MIKNRQAYQDGYDRAIAGKPARTLVDILMNPFESHRTREAREQGARDGALERRLGGSAGESPILEAWRRRFDAMFDEMQTTEAKTAYHRSYSATSEEMGRAAVEAVRRRTRDAG